MREYITTDLLLEFSRRIESVSYWKTGLLVTGATSTHIDALLMKQHIRLPHSSTSWQMPGVTRHNGRKALDTYKANN